MGFYFLMAATAFVAASSRSSAAVMGRPLSVRIRLASCTLVPGRRRKRLQRRVRVGRRSRRNGRKMACKAGFLRRAPRPGRQRSATNHSAGAAAGEHIKSLTYGRAGGGREGETAARAARTTKAYVAAARRSSHDLINLILAHLEHLILVVFM